MDDLERVLMLVTKEQRGKPLTRRFIVTEGISENVGDIVDLPAIVCSAHSSCLLYLKNLADLPHRLNSSYATNSG
jgi:7-keto-8-aminopelargonate synthetase-like enzyme